ncbi:response regulator [Flavobacterium psychrotrophum]|uniref:response regulator n=1 Tax=Flavobacterium psychrotrophum TaxID=2294119 RepID=UPI000E30C4D0|nr:response regulator [Flavobacterium psychrotrophum]
MEELLFGTAATVGGSLINFTATKCYNHFTGSQKNFLWYENRIDLNTFNFNSEFHEQKRRTRIVVIDDENSFPIELFTNEGYNITKWDTVKDYGKLESGYFDIIVLDIKGVAQHISDDDGLGVLVELKKKNSSQIIISYSQHSYDLSKVQFFQMADDNITKPSDFLRIKSTLDNLITTQFKPSRYISALNKKLHDHHIDAKNTKNINNEIAKAIKRNSDPDWNSTLKFLNHTDHTLIQEITSLSQTILKFYKNGR